MKHTIYFFLGFAAIFALCIMGIKLAQTACTCPIPEVREGHSYRARLVDGEWVFLHYRPCPMCKLSDVPALEGLRK